MSQGWILSVSQESQSFLVPELLVAGGAVEEAWFVRVVTPFHCTGLLHALHLLAYPDGKGEVPEAHQRCWVQVESHNLPAGQAPYGLTEYISLPTPQLQRQSTMTGAELLIS